MVRVFVALDSCSTDHFIRFRALALLGLNTVTSLLHTVAFGSGSSKVREKTDLELTALDGQFTIEVKEVYVVKEICEAVEFNNGESSFCERIDILLGSALAFHLITDVQPNGMVRSRLGSFKVSERQFNKGSGEVRSVTLLVISNEDLDERLQKFWNIENALLDSMCKEDDELIANHKRALDLIRERTILKDGHYVMPLLFKEGVDRPKNNFGHAMQRLRSLERKFEKVPGLKERYVQTLNEHIEQYASLVPAEEINCEECFYLPHAAVLRDEKTSTKTRIVFDASAKDKSGISLNDRLLPGPAIHPDLVGILLRFRTKRVALVGDIRKMFLQIGLFDEDKKYHRFLWRENPSDPVRHFQMQVTTFGLADSPVKAIMCIRMHVLRSLEGLRPGPETASSPKAAAAISLLTNCFVDDVLSGADDEEAAFRLYEEMVLILRDAGFELRKFLSNSPKLMSRIPPEMRGESQVISLTENIEEGEGYCKALGLGWLLQKDAIAYTNLSYDENAEITKRTMSSEVARLFDPVGLISPFVMRGKILLQKTWAEKNQWDEQVKPELAREFSEWRRQIKDLGQVTLPRCIYESSAYRRLELHCFSDASEAAMGAAVYCKIFYDHGITSHLLLAKGKVASLKDVTLPRKELVGILIGARIVRHAAHELNIDQKDIVCHTDSLTAWQWLQKEPDTWKLYVRNRVKMIRSLININQIFHVPGVENPADLVSRGCAVGELSDFWFKGPEFLRTESLAYPKDNSVDSDELAECLSERREKKAKALIVNLARTDRLRQVIFAKSRMRTFLNVTAYCMRVIRAKGKPEQIEIAESERQQALLFWIREEQIEHFGDEMGRLTVDTPVSGKSQLKPLNPFYDNVHQVLRVGGRLQEANLPFEQTFPVILPKTQVARLQDIHESVTARLIMSVHEKNAHAGADWVLATLRSQGFWVLRGKQSVRKVIRRCVACQKATKLKESQLMGNLPAYRLERDVKPFTNVGVDAAGPVYLRQRKGEDGQRKAYIMVFTCLTSRACHLELAIDMTAETLIQCFRRVIGRRGKIAQVLSDNHKTNIRAEKEIQVLLEKARDANSDLTWRFTPEFAPWCGGVYEKTIRSVKEALRKVLGKSVINEWELMTVLCEVEAFLNDRPLCPVSDDITQFDPVTPSMLMLGEKLSHLPGDLPRALPDDLTESQIVKAWKRRQSLSKQFWNRWVKDYMGGLQVRQKWRDERADIRVGELVLIATENQPRGSWPLARVVKTENVHNLRDIQSEKTRSVVVRFESGKESRRPVQHLVRLEVH